MVYIDGAKICGPAMSDFVHDLPEDVLQAPRRRWFARNDACSKRKLSRYHPDETGPGDHYLSPAAMHLREALYLHGAGRCCVFPLSDGTLTLLAIRDEIGIRKYTLVVRVKDFLLSKARLIIQDGLYAGSVLQLDQSFAGIQASERFVEDNNPDLSSTEVHLHYMFKGQDEVKQISIRPYTFTDR